MTGLASADDRFAACLPLLLKHEGGYVDHSEDPGGATNLGVTLGTLQDWRGGIVTKADVKALTKADVAPIYREKYWWPAACDRLPPGVDYMVFDLAVNSGVSRAKRYLQEAAGVVADGKIGPITLNAIHKAGAREIITRMAARREAFYRGLSTFPTFGKGWLRRLREVTAHALKLAAA